MPTDVTSTPVDEVRAALERNLAECQMIPAYEVRSQLLRVEPRIFNAWLRDPECPLEVAYGVGKGRRIRLSVVKATIAWRVGKEPA